MLTVTDLTIDFGNRLLFDNVSFSISTGDRIALVGRNGAGKSTLMKLIAKIETPHGGTISMLRGLRVGYLPQVMQLVDDRTVYQEVERAFDHITLLEQQLEELSREMGERTDYESNDYIELIERYASVNDALSLIQEGGNYHAQIERTLLGLGFVRSDFDRETSTFSGGWRMRIELARVLLERPDLLLLDEPTNHLDLESIQWLEGFLAKSKGALLLVSHDRVFLDTVTRRTIELEMGKLYDYKTNYSHYVELREERLEQQRRAFENQQKMIKKTEVFIDRFRYKATKSVQVQSRIKQLDKIDRIELDEIDRRSMRFHFRPAVVSGAYPVIAEGLSKAYGDNLVFSGVDITIERGQKVALVGKNGAGKSTFVKCLMEEVRDYTGKLEIGHNVIPAYFAQNEAQSLNPELTVYDTIDSVATGDIRLQINAMLGAFMFGGETSEKKVGVLSGGERSRLALLRLLLRPANLLILDEPTNHLDMNSKDVLKEAVARFEGTVIVVSHDRDFLDGLVSTVYEFKDGGVTEHLGGIYEYIVKNAGAAEQNTSQMVSQETERETSSPEKNLAALDYQAQKEVRARLKSLERAIKKDEQEIALLEAKIAEAEAKMAIPDAVFDDASFRAYDELKKQLSAVMVRWEEAVIALEESD